MADNETQEALDLINSVVGTDNGMGEGVTYADSEPAAPAPVVKAEPVASAPVSAPTPEPVAAPPADPKPDDSHWAKERQESAEIASLRKDMTAMKRSIDKEKEFIASQYEQKLAGRLDVQELLANPIQLLAKHGLRFEDLAESAIKQHKGTKDPTDPVFKQEFKQTTSEVGELKKQLQAMQAQLADRDFNSQIDRAMLQPEFRAFQAYGELGYDVHSQVKQMASEHYKKTQELLTPEQALAKMLEAEREDVRRKLEHPVLKEVYGISTPEASPQQTVTTPTQAPMSPSVVPPTRPLEQNPQGELSIADMPGETIEEKLNNFSKQLEAQGINDFNNPNHKSVWGD